MQTASLYFYNAYMENTKKLTATVIALEEPDTLRDRLGCAEWASTESIKIMRSIGTKDIALLSGLAHNSLKCIDLQDAIISNLPVTTRRSL